MFYTGFVAVEAGEDNIFPDPMSRSGHKLWRDNPTALEQRMSSL